MYGKARHFSTTTGNAIAAICPELLHLDAPFSISWISGNADKLSYPRMQIHLHHLQVDAKN